VIVSAPAFRSLHRHPDCGHLDTVHPVGTLANFRSGRTACGWGPGIVDMKGGNYLALEAIGNCEATGRAFGCRCCSTATRRLASPSTRDVIEAEAAAQIHASAGPARPDGGVVPGRNAIARLNLELGHAGARLADWRSAIRGWRVS
jgi:glutamate carboxypeptidase